MSTVFFTTFQAIQTRRLLLRQIRESDAEALFHYYKNPNVTQYLDWGGPASVPGAVRIIREWNEAYERRNFIRWGVTIKGEEQMIGTVVIHTKEQNAPYGLFTHPIAEVVSIGYELSEAYWNQGIATEAVEAVIRFVFRYISTPRIQAYVEPENKYSLQLLKRMGMREEGLLRSYLYDDKTRSFNDILMLALLREDYHRMIQQ